MRTLWLLTVAAMLGAAQSRTPVSTTLHTFEGFPNDGSTPNMVIGRDGKLYGTASSGGTRNSGTIYRLEPPEGAGGAWTEIVLYNFQGGRIGSYPIGALVPGPNGVSYGAASGGSAACGGCGFVFELKPAAAGGAWTLTALYQFTGGSDGAGPLTLAAGANGVLYGTTDSGGIACSENALGCGVVFSLTPPASLGGTWTETVLYSFAGGSDGWYPGALAAGGDGVLYGIASQGGPECADGGPYGCGLVFALIPPATAGQAWTKIVVHAFAGGCCDGADPSSFAIGGDGALYAATSSGGVQSCTMFNLGGCGAVVRLSQAAPHEAWTETVLYDFQNLGDGAGPSALAIGKDGWIYGTAWHGGASGAGTVFRLQPGNAQGGAWTETTLYSFALGTGGELPLPIGPIIGGGGVLYGTTLHGGASDYGTVFQLVP